MRYGFNENYEKTLNLWSSRVSESIAKSIMQKSIENVIKANMFNVSSTILNTIFDKCFLERFK